MHSGAKDVCFREFRLQLRRGFVSIVIVKVTVSQPWPIAERRPYDRESVLRVSNKPMEIAQGCRSNSLTDIDSRRYFTSLD